MFILIKFRPIFIINKQFFILKSLINFFIFKKGVFLFFSLLIEFNFEFSSMDFIFYKTDIFRFFILTYKIYRNKKNFKLNTLNTLKTKWFTLQYEVRVDSKSQLNIKLYQEEHRQED